MFTRKTSLSIRALLIAALLTATTMVTLAPTAAASHTTCTPVFVVTPGLNADGWTNQNDIAWSWHFGSSSCNVNAVSYHEARRSWASGTLAGCFNTKTCSYAAVDIPDGAGQYIEARFLRSCGFLCWSWTAWGRSTVSIDTVAPTIDLKSPGSNAVYVDGAAIETCNGNGKVSNGGETVADVPSVDMPEEVPDAPDAPESVTVEDPAGQGIIVGPVAVPSAPANASGPNMCAGKVASATAGQTTVVETPEQLTELDPTLPARTQIDPVSQDVSFNTFILVSGVVTFEADIADALSGIKRVEFVVDGEVLETAANGNGLYAFAWDTATYAAGDHAVTLRATDLAGNSASVSFTAIVASGETGEITPPDVPEIPEDG